MAIYYTRGTQLLKLTELYIDNYVFYKILYSSYKNYNYALFEYVRNRIDTIKSNIWECIFSKTIARNNNFDDVDSSIQDTTAYYLNEFYTKVDDDMESFLKKDSDSISYEKFILELKEQTYVLLNKVKMNRRSI